MAVPLLHRPHPVRGQGALPGLSGAQPQHRVTAPAPHPRETRGGKFAAGSPRCLHAHLGLQESPGPLTCRTRSRTHTPARRLQDPSPPSQVWTSEAAGATAPRRSGANRAPPLRAGPDPPEQRRPRASTEPGAQQRQRRGTYCASAGRLPRPLSPRRLRRRGAAGAAGAQSAAGLGLGLGPRGRGLGRHQAGRPAAGCARRHCAPWRRRARRALSLVPPAPHPLPAPCAVGAGGAGSAAGAERGAGRRGEERRAQSGARGAEPGVERDVSGAQSGAHCGARRLSPQRCGLVARSSLPPRPFAWPQAVGLRSGGTGDAAQSRGWAQRAEVFAGLHPSPKM